MQISWPKTKLMAITPKPTNHLPLKICNKDVLFVDSFTYLGSLITNDGSSSRDITSRIAKAAYAMCRLSNWLNVIVIGLIIVGSVNLITFEETPSSTQLFFEGIFYIVFPTVINVLKMQYSIYMCIVSSYFI